MTARGLRPPRRVVQPRKPVNLHLRKPKTSEIIKKICIEKTTLTASGEKNVFVAEGCLLNH